MTEEYGRKKIENMGISGIGNNPYYFNKAQYSNRIKISFGSQETNQKFLSDCPSLVENEQVRKNRKIDIADIQKNVYRSSMLRTVCYSNESATKSKEPIEFPLETEGYKIEEAEQFEGVQAYILTDKLTGNNFYIREDQLVIQKDEKSGNEFVINMDQPYSYNIRVTEEFKTLLQDLADKQGFELDEVPMKNNMTVKRDSKTGLEYLTTEGREWEGISVVIKSQEDLNKLQKLTDEFSAYPMCNDSHVASLYALLEIGGNLRRGTEGFTYLTDKWITYASYDGKRSNSWELEMEEGMFDIAKKALHSDFDFSSSDMWVKKIQSSNMTQ